MGSPCQRGDARGERLRRGWAAERAGPRGCGPRVGAGRSWAAEGVGFGLVPGEGKRPGEEWVWAGLGREVGCGLGFGFCFGFFLSISIYSLISNLSQTKVEFKYEFEFKPQSIKSMHQHECNTKF